MKVKINNWGNSHGIRISSTLLDHLNVESGDEVEIMLTKNGIVLLKAPKREDHVKTLIANTIRESIAASSSVKTVKDPYNETDVEYIVITANPCNPIIREVQKGTAGAYSTLIDAKEAARNIIQNAIKEGKDSLSEIRQVGIDNIEYISL